MNRFIVALAMLVACDPQSAPPPDAPVDAGRLPPVTESGDAAVAPPDSFVNKAGCAMGNLPDSRTITLVNGDPLPPDLINELQDNIVAGARSAGPTSFFPQQWFTPGTIICVQNPTSVNETIVWKMTSAGVAFRTQIPFRGGDRISGLEVDLLGDGVVDLSNTTTLVQYFPSVDDPVSAGLGTIGSLSATNVPATWGSFAFTVTPTLLAGAGYLQLRVAPSNGTFLHFGRIRPIFSRP